MEQVTICIERDNPSPRKLVGYFAEVFAAMDEYPRQMQVEVRVENEEGLDFELDLEEGEIVVRCRGKTAARGKMRGRYLAEHPVPMVLRCAKATRFIFEPTTGNRVKVRLARRRLWG